MRDIVKEDYQGEMGTYLGIQVVGTRYPEVGLSEW